MMKKLPVGIPDRKNPVSLPGVFSSLHNAVTSVI